MNSYNELEVELDSLDAENYRVTLRFTKGTAALSTPREVGPENVHIDREVSLRREPDELLTELSGEVDFVTLSNSALTKPLLSCTNL
jgi:hypothetical protein